MPDERVNASSDPDTVVENIATREEVDPSTAQVWIIVAIAVGYAVRFVLAKILWSSPSDSSASGAFALPDVGVAVFDIVAFAALVFFAYRDNRELTRRGMTRPFGWGWAFLPPIVYLTGRSVVVRRRTGRGRLPLWIYLGSLALCFAVNEVIINIAWNNALT